MKKPLDRRVQKTRAALQEALLDVMVEKGYEAITVQDLIDRANIGRTTFYFHFADKEALLKECIHHLLDFLQAPWGKDEDRTESLHFGFSLAMLEHVQSHRLVYKAVVGKQSGAAVLNSMKTMLEEAVASEIARLCEQGKLKTLSKDILTAHVAGSFWSVLHWWMEQKTPCSAREMDRIFHEMVVSGIRGNNFPAKSNL